MDRAILDGKIRGTLKRWPSAVVQYQILLSQIRAGHLGIVRLFRQLLFKFKFQFLYNCLLRSGPINLLIRIIPNIAKLSRARRASDDQLVGVPPNRQSRWQWIKTPFSSGCLKLTATVTRRSGISTGLPSKILSTVTRVYKM